MREWFLQNGSTLIVGAVVAVLVALVIIRMVHNKRKGKRSCSCGCSDCGNPVCHHQDKQ